MSCTVCGGIPELLRANTGRDVYLPEPARVLKPIGDGSREQLRVCPSCHRVFLYEDEQAFTGSGNDDEERLTAYPPAQSELIDAFVRRDGRSAAGVAERAPELFALAAPAPALVLQYVDAHDAELRSALLPERIVHVSRTGKTFSPRKDDAEEILALIGPEPKGPLEELRAACVEMLCVACPDLLGNRAAFRKLGASDELDYWECEGCRAGFLYSRSGSDERLTRMQRYMSDAMRACVSGGAEIPESASGLVFASDGARLFKVLLAHGLKSDRGLLEKLMPGIVVQLANRGEHWLYDWLRSYAGSGELERRLVREAAAAIDPVKHYQGHRAAALARELA